MLERTHNFRISTTWTGNLGAGTAHYRAYSRNHEICSEGKRAAIPGSSDPAFRGETQRYSPEELLVASLSGCHMLWVLHLSADAGIVVTEYRDDASGTLHEHPDGSGDFTSVTLRPQVTITDAARVEEARALHARAHQLCFIARSMKFPVRHEPVISARGAAEEGS